MKTTMKAVILPMLIAMFVWGCGVSEPGGGLDNNSNQDCDAQKLCESEGYDFAIDACTTENSQPPMACETFELCGEKVACHSKTGKDENNNTGNNNNDCKEKIECPEGTYQVDNCNDPDIADNCGVVSICDERIFCVKGEEPECKDKPVCPDGFTQTDQCPQDDVICQEATLCGITIQCYKETKNDCEDGPQCPDGLTQIPREDCGVQADGTVVDCKQIEDCGETIFCADVPEDCSEGPVCPEGTVVVSKDECTKLKKAGLDCKQVISCDEELLCAEINEHTCTDKPECPDGSYEIDKEKCGKDGAGNIIECFPSETVCEETIMCTKVRVECIVPPECPEGTFSVEKERCNFTDQDAANYCKIIEECGEILYCIENQSNCDGVPTCPEGSTQVDKCKDPDNADECEHVTMCGQTISCEKIFL